MDFNIDFKAILNAKLNGELLKEKEIAPVIKVCNKYGIHGMDAVAFLTELGIACEQAEGEQENG